MVQYIACIGRPAHANFHDDIVTACFVKIKICQCRLHFKNGRAYTMLSFNFLPGILHAVHIGIKSRCVYVRAIDGKTFLVAKDCRGRIKPDPVALQA